MGYDTYFEDCNNMTEEQMEKLAEIVGFTLKFPESMKWYDYKTHMAQLSIHYPEETFCLRGSGEDDEDLWRYFWKNGVVTGGKACITYPGEEENPEAVCEPLPPPPIDQNLGRDLFTIKSDNDINWDF